MPKGSNSVGVCVVRMVERQDTAAPPRPGPAPDSHPEVGKLTPGSSSQPFRGSPVHQAARWLETTRDTRPHKPLMTSRSRRTEVVGGHTPVRKRVTTDRPRPTSSPTPIGLGPRPKSRNNRIRIVRYRSRDASVPGTLPTSKSSPRCQRGGPPEAWGPSARPEKGPMDRVLAIAVLWFAVAIVVALLIGRSIRLADLNAKLARAPDEQPSVAEDVPDLVEDGSDLVQDASDLVEDEPRAEVAAPEDMPGDVSPSSGPQGETGSATAPGESRASVILPPHHPAVRPPTGRRPAAPKRTHPTGPIG